MQLRYITRIYNCKQEPSPKVDTNKRYLKKSTHETIKLTKIAHRKSRK